MVVGSGGLALFFQNNSEVHFRFVVSGIELKNFLVSFLSFMTIAFFFVNNGEVEKRSGICLFVNCYFKEMDGLVKVLSELVQQHSNIEVGLKVLGVDGQCPLVKTVALFERFICGWGF